VDELVVHARLTLAWFALSAVTFLVLQFISAPYGKHIRDGWGPTIPNRLGWLVMETPPIVVFATLFAVGTHRDPAAFVFATCFLVHYVYRGWVYPFRLQTDGKRMPLVVCALAFFTNIVIGYLQARWLFTLGPERDASWLADPRFVVGLGLFVFGFAVNHHSDAILRNLRRPGETGYKIPIGGGFRWVSSPHYLGEIIEWGGWALMTWSAPTAAFFAWTVSNLVPRAAENHRWYHERFGDAYPRERRRVVPWVY